MQPCFWHKTQTYWMDCLGFKQKPQQENVGVTNNHCGKLHINHTHWKGNMMLCNQLFIFFIWYCWFIEGKQIQKIRFWIWLKFSVLFADVAIYTLFCVKFIGEIITAQSLMSDCLHYNISYITINNKQATCSHIYIIKLNSINLSKSFLEKH